VKSRGTRWAGHVARMGERRGPYRVLVGTPERKLPLGRPRRVWKDNIKIDLQEVGWRNGLTHLSQNRDMRCVLVKAIMTIRVPQNAGNFLTS